MHHVQVVLYAQCRLASKWETTEFEKLSEALLNDINCDKNNTTSDQSKVDSCFLTYGNPEVRIYMQFQCQYQCHRLICKFEKGIPTGRVLSIRWVFLFGKLG